LSLTEHAIVSRIADRTSVSQPSDFVLQTGRAVDRSRLADPDVSPYCFDVAREELLCVSTPDISQATFLYQAQRESARSVIMAPFEALPETRRSPTLIFSIGRCGSTLLTKAFAAAGVRAVSEPDYFTQAALLPGSASTLQSAIGRATELLPYEAIKLRAECSNAPLFIAGAFPAPKVMFILRDAVDWADSVRRVSRAPSPSGIAELLRTLVIGMEGLAANYPVRVCYYEDFRVLTARYVNALIEWMGSRARIRPAMASELAARDAQEGSAMARAAVGSGDDRSFRDAFRHEWEKVRPRALIERLELRGL
jgi:hypothetical protein